MLMSGLCEIRIASFRKALDKIMTKPSLLTLAAASAALALAIGAPRARAAGKTVVVTMTDKPPQYHPETLKIPVGTTVEWDNNAKTLHDVTTDASSAQNPADVKLPPGAKPFDSGFMQPGATFKYTFTAPGEYTYICIPHEKDHMVGHLVVTK